VAPQGPPRRPPSRGSRGSRVTSRTRSRRIRALTGVVVLLMCLLGARAAFLGTVRAGDLADRGREAQRAEVDLLAQRGAILAADGTDLSTDQLAVDVTASPMVIVDPNGVAAQLGAVLKRDPNEIANVLSKGGGYAVVARAVPPAVADKARALGLPGIYFSDTYKRFLPGRFQASQVIGLTGAEHEGISGLETQYDETLTGTPGRRVEVRDLFGRPIQVLADKEAVEGTDIRTTLDPAIQDFTEATLAAAREQYGAKSAMAIVMNPQNGAILAMATVPRFDPNDRRVINPELERNRPVVDTFEPGSTFKIVPMVAALEDGKVTPGTTFHIPGDKIVLYDGKFTLSDAHEHGPQTLTATQILEESSNIGVSQISLKVGRERLEAWMKRFGFGASTGIDFPGEAAGYLPPGDKWFGTGIYTFPIGQGVTVNLTQMARAYAAIANGGNLVTPHLVAGPQAAASRPIMSARTAGQVDRMLRKVVSERDGTGNLADVEGYDVAGKTGTAEKIDPTTGLYNHLLYTSSFVGYAPADDPQLLVAVVVDEPTAGSYYGGDVAAPAFAEITEFALQRMRIRP
jgi:cell division protein FtsI (penicillin-binding protein 3)